jgi:hypothetical protein
MEWPATCVVYAGSASNARARRATRRGSRLDQAYHRCGAGMHQDFVTAPDGRKAVRLKGEVAGAAGSDSMLRLDGCQETSLAWADAADPLPRLLSALSFLRSPAPDRSKSIVATARENSSFSSSAPHCRRFGSRAVQGEFGGNIPDYGLLAQPFNPPVVRPATM